MRQHLSGRGERRLADGGGRATLARRRLLQAHADAVADVIDAADEVSGEAEAPLTESTAVTEPLSAALAGRDLPDRLLDALADAVDAVGESLPHDPVAEPPYLAVTSRGPVLRATLSEGRLVVVVGVFAVERTGERRYVRAGETPGEVVRVEFHGPDSRAVAGPGGGETNEDGPTDRGADSRGDGA